MDEPVIKEEPLENDFEDSVPIQNTAPPKVVKIMTVLNKENNQTYQVVQSVNQEDGVITAVRLPQTVGKPVKFTPVRQETPNVTDKLLPVPALVPINTSKKIVFKCFKCKALYATQNEVVNHIKIVHSDSKVSPTASTPAEKKVPGAAKQDVGVTVKKDSGSQPIHCCKICKTTCDTVNLMYEHYKSVHEIDNPYLRNSKQAPQEPPQLIITKLQCESCGVTFAKRSGLIRHKRNFHNDSGMAAGICHHCGNKYKLSALAFHEKKCGTRVHPRRRQDCFVEGCGSSYYRKADLIRHAKDDHKLDIAPMQTLRFPNEEEFKKWKENEEDRTFSYYSKHAGTKGNARTYYCQHEGSERAHRSSEDNREKVKSNKKGRIKKGVVCTSYLRVKITDEELIAYYYPSHSHPISPDDLKYQPLSKEILQFIKEQIALNVPHRQIHAMAKKRLAETKGCKRDTFISLKRITSLAQRYRREQSARDEVAPKVYLETFNSFIDALCAQDESPVLFYQAPSEDAHLDGPNQEDHLFFLGLQTTDQQKMLQRESAMPMFISVTKSDYTLQYYLVSIIVPCENNFEYPVGHLISSQLNEDVVSLFLQTIGERCPELNVNCIVSLDCLEINNAINKVFGSDGPYFLSKWHFLDFMRKDFLKGIPSNKEEELFDFILAMTEAESEDRFLFLYNSFKEQFDASFPDIVLNFADYFVRASAWASCYRQGTGMIDSCLYADSFFSKLNKKFRRRPSKSLHLLPDLLLHMQEVYRDRRDDGQGQADCDEDMKEQHIMGLEIPSDLVQETLSRHWTVQASKHGQTFHVMQCSQKCYEEDCVMKCKDCVTLCSHMYFCTCDRSESICLHVHKIHQMCGSVPDNEDNAEDGGSYLMEHDGDSVGEECPPSNDLENQSDSLAGAEVTRANILKNLDALRQVVDQRCVPEEMTNVINETLESLCNLIGGS